MVGLALIVVIVGTATVAIEADRAQAEPLGASSNFRFPKVRPQAEDPAAQPNIVFIFTDDQDEASLPFMPIVNSELVAKGTTFDNYFVPTALCCPSRVSTLRGQYAHNHGVREGRRYVDFFGQGQEDSTMATWLQDVGYNTMFAGKYVNGYPGNVVPNTHVPPGWDDFSADNTGHGYFGYGMNENGQAVTYGFEESDYHTDVVAGKAVDFIETAPQQEPLFMWLSVFAPHLDTTGTPVPAPRHVGAFNGEIAPRPPSFNEADVSDKPAAIRNLPLLTQTDIDQIDTVHRARLESLLAVDELVGDVVAALGEAGRLENTFIFFSSDNGWHAGLHRLLLGKNQPYEEDHGVPLVVRGPGVPAGASREELSLNTDLAPTFADLAGAQIPEFVDGRSLVPLLGGGAPPSNWRQAFVIEKWRGGEERYRGIRTPELKYVEWCARPECERELYDLESDPYELESLHATVGPEPLTELELWLDALSGCRAASCRLYENNPPMPPPFDAGHVRLDGEAGNYGHRSIPKTDDPTVVDVRVSLALDDWTPGSVQGVAGSNNNRLRLEVTPSRFVRAKIALDSGLVTVISPHRVPRAFDGERLWVRYVFDTSTGEISFYWSQDSTGDHNAVSWQLLAGGVSTGTTGNLKPIRELVVGQVNSSAGRRMAGKVFGAGWVFDGVGYGIDLTTVGELTSEPPDFSEWGAWTFVGSSWEYVPVSGAFEGRVVAGSDDAEERPSGSVDLSSSDLELVEDGSSTQTVGVRWTGVTVPQGASISDAWVQFTADRTDSVATNLMVAGHLIGDSPRFLGSSGNISNRVRTGSTVPWAPGEWGTVGEAGVEQRTPNLAGVIQEIVDQPGWVSGNALSLIITGSGTRTAEAFDGQSSAAPLLHIEYGDWANDPPVANDDAASTGAGQLVVVDVAANDSDSSLDVTTTNVTCPGCSGPGSGSLVNHGDGTFTYTPNPGYVGTDGFTYEICDTGGLCATAQVTITVTRTFEKRVVAGSDDAEERPSGSVDLSSSDLELVEDGSSTQTVGVRWRRVTVPQGASISDAWVQFTADRTDSVATNLMVAGHLIGDSPRFLGSSGNISNRVRTGSTVPWAPGEWGTVGEAGVEQRTPNLAGVIQEIVDQPGWVSGNALSLIITGSGTRTAEAFDGQSSAAPLLHIEYTIS